MQLLTEVGGSAKVGQHSFGANFLISTAWKQDHRPGMWLNALSQLSKKSIVGERDHQEIIGSLLEGLTSPRPISGRLEGPKLCKASNQHQKRISQPRGGKQGP